MSITEPAIAQGSAEVYPRPALPMLPPLSLSMFRGREASEFGSVFLDDDALFLPSGRAALALALRRLRIADGDAVLLPAYHCQSMVTPVRWAGADPHFYRMNPDLSPDLEQLEELLVPPVKALVLVHYFGFVQPTTRLRELCDGRGAALIEDCAHAFLGRRGTDLPGSRAQYSVASSRKFFPGADGGMLRAERDELGDVGLESPPLMAQLKGIAKCVQQGADGGKLGLPSGIISRALGLLDRSGPSVAQESVDPTAGNSPGGDRSFEPAEVSRKGRAVSRLLMRATSIDWMARIRRRNYAAYLEGFADMPCARPLYPEMSEAVVPYVFPLIIDDPERHFARLKHAGVPIWRWEDLSPSDCELSCRYLHKLLQLPCHQELTPREIDWIISRVRSICGNGSA